MKNIINFVIRHIFISTFIICMIMSLFFTELVYHFLFNNGGIFYIHLIISCIVALFVLIIDKDELENFSYSYLHDTSK